MRSGSYPKEKSVYLRPAYLICVALQGLNHAFQPFMWRFDIHDGDHTWSDGLFWGLWDTSSLLILGFIWSQTQWCSLIFIISLDWLLLGDVVRHYFGVRQWFWWSKYIRVHYMYDSIWSIREFHHQLHLCDLEVQVLQTSHSWIYVCFFCRKFVFLVNKWMCVGC